MSLRTVGRFVLAWAALALVGLIIGFADGSWSTFIVGMVGVHVWSAALWLAERPAPIVNIVWSEADR